MSVAAVANAFAVIAWCCVVKKLRLAREGAKKCFYTFSFFCVVLCWRLKSHKIMYKLFKDMHFRSVDVWYRLVKLDLTMGLNSVCLSVCLTVNPRGFQILN